MKLGLILSQTEPETVFNALRLANYSLAQGDRFGAVSASTLKDLYEIVRDSDHLLTF
jgi:hypothetical protein